MQRMIEHAVDAVQYALHQRQNTANQVFDEADKREHKMLGCLQKRSDAEIHKFRRIFEDIHQPLPEGGEGIPELREDVLPAEGIEERARIEGPCHTKTEAGS